MSHVYIEDIGRHEGEAVTIKGWLHNRRSSGKIHFLIIRDGSGFIQGVMSKAAVGEAMSRSSAVRLENGVLLVEAQTSQWAAAIMRASPMILSRLHGTLGPDAVREIRLRR